MNKFLYTLGIVLFATNLTNAQVTLSGTGKVFARPDMATVEFVVNSEGETAAEAHNKNIKAMRAFSRCRSQ